MIFSSIEFLLYFLPAFFILYGLTPKPYRNATLLAGSLVFYALGEPRYLLLLLVSLLLNYYAGMVVGVRAPKGKMGKKGPRKSGQQKRKDFIFVLALLGNLGVLVFFKLGGAGGTIPLGISFYTFQILSYLIDAYRGTIPREKSLLRLSVYITMFPQLLAGPIVSYSEVQRELGSRELTAENIQDGLKLFTMGLGAKVLLADRIGILWHEVSVTGYESISTPMAWLAAAAYSMKIYFDFYGYSLMAQGLGRMLGFALPENFRLPYMARSVRDFYRRWHITLGMWFRRYVYIPLGGSRGGALRTAGNLLVVWILTALWHGCSVNFLLWGGILCLCILTERFLASRKFFQKHPIWKRLRVLPHLYLWLVIPISWVCFAIPELSDLTVYVSRMFGFGQEQVMRSKDWLAALERYGALFGVSFLCSTPLAEKAYRRFCGKWWAGLLLGGLFWVCVWRLVQEGENPFLYFRF